MAVLMSNIDVAVGLVFRLRNTGKVAFKRDEIYWHISVEDGLQPEVEDPGRFLRSKAGLEVHDGAKEDSDFS